MIHISHECVEAYKAQSERNDLGYLKSVADKVSKENPVFYKQMLDTAGYFADIMVEKRDDVRVTDEQFKRDLTVNIMHYCLSVYKCIDNQMEINELEKTYG